MEETKQSILDVARMAPVIIGNKASIIKFLNENFPLQDPKAADASTKYFYAEVPFDQQVERVMNYGKTRNNSYVYAVIPYMEHVPEAELTEDLKNVPEQYRALRFVRAEIHR